MKINMILGAALLASLGSAAMAQTPAGAAPAATLPSASPAAKTTPAAPAPSSAAAPAPTAPAPAAPVAAAPMPAAAPPPAPAWRQGMSAEQEKSALHPFAPHLTGRAASTLPVNKLTVPDGFKVEVWAEGVPEARSLALGDNGTVFVSNRNLTNVYAIVDNGGKREVKTLLKGMRAPNGIVFDKGTLYVAERHRITRYDNIEAKLDDPGQGQVVIDNLDPNIQPGHFWKYMRMGPDGMLYFNVGAPDNIVMPTYNEAAILRVDPKSGRIENYAQGVRNSVGMDFHPVTKQLWFTEHGRDWMGTDLPHDELNVVKTKGEHFGYPYCHQGDVLDPVFGKSRSCQEFTAPVMNLGAHIAPMGMKFYTGSMFPKDYKNSMLIAQHGSWNRDPKQGFDVIRVTVDNKGKVTKHPFVSGFLENDRADPPMWGRPVDVLQMKDGSILFSDDFNGILYRVSYAKKAA
ncbi:MAG: PQQ-dependent sugar dehydrogenase [Polaromonas sp.]|nr:PQQ-dependent sugar dehydrogenase [Polaromonas sp.]